ncbi:IS3 family transposase, partial [Escherichia coli]|uniref:IS3 family transposase n=1 Tax=Escherichia coli TaxID=562 RepID=UPI002DBB3C92
RLRFSGPKTSIICSPMTSLKTSIKTITYLSDIGCLEIHGASLINGSEVSRLSVAIQGNCYDNAPMESFWGTLKNESLSHYRFNNRDEAISVIREYIEIFYNRQRRHSRLGNISPAAFREKYHQMAA